MEPMRVRARVVGNTLVLEDGVTLPEGTEVEVLTSDEGVQIDDAAAAELAEAMKEADTEGGVPAEEVFAALPPTPGRVARTSLAHESSGSNPAPKVMCVSPHPSSSAFRSPSRFRSSRAACRDTSTECPVTVRAR